MMRRRSAFRWERTRVVSAFCGDKRSHASVMKADPLAAEPSTISSRFPDYEAVIDQAYDFWLSEVRSCDWAKARTAG